MTRVDHDLVVRAYWDALDLFVRSSRLHRECDELHGKLLRLDVPCVSDGMPSAVCDQDMVTRRLNDVVEELEKLL